MFYVYFCVSLPGGFHGPGHPGHAELYFNTVLTVYFNVTLELWEVWFSSEPSMACWWAPGGCARVFLKNKGKTSSKSYRQDDDSGYI